MRYEEVDFEVIYFSQEDVITQSTCDPVTGEGDETCIPMDN